MAKSREECFVFKFIFRVAGPVKELICARLILTVYRFGTSFVFSLIA